MHHTVQADHQLVVGVFNGQGGAQLGSQGRQVG